jgi:uncharacterized protein DUF5672
LSDRPPRPELPDVTLVAVTSVAVGATAQALRASMRQAQFARVLWLSDKPPPTEIETEVEWRRIEPLRSRSDYSLFMLRELGGHVLTSHVLCVQWDGFVLRGPSWDPAFLEFDYIGAVWPQFSDGHNVGNGGFSLRSRRLLEACKSLPMNDDEAEDLVIGRHCRRQLEQEGLRFAPESVARRFAFERTASTGGEFGFHGAFNLVRLLPPKRFLPLLRDIEPGVLTTRERVELLRWALSRREWKLALTMLARLA